MLTTRAGRHIFSLLAKPEKLSVMIYHRVLASPDPMNPNEITAREFDRQLQWLTGIFNIITLENACDHLRHKTLPRRSMVITFDDGYEDNCSIALPILQKHKIAATFFVASDFLDGGMMWNDRIIEWLRSSEEREVNLEWLDLGVVKVPPLDQRAALADKILSSIKHRGPEQRAAAVDRLTASTPLTNSLMMTSSQVRTLSAAGMEIGGHTCSHPILATLGADSLRQEIGNNRTVLEALINKPVSSFAYPNGKPVKDYNEQSVQAVKDAGYLQAVTTSPGVSAPESDFYQLPRFTPWRRNPPGFLSQLGANYFTRTNRLSAS